MDLKGRIKILSVHLGLSIREFERECGLKRGTISNMTGALGSDKLSKIIDRAGEYFPGRFRRRRQNELRGRRLAAGDRQHGVQPDQLYGIAVAPVEIAAKTDRSE